MILKRTNILGDHSHCKSLTIDGDSNFKTPLFFQKKSRSKIGLYLGDFPVDNIYNILEVVIGDDSAFRRLISSNTGDVGDYHFMKDNWVRYDIGGRIFKDA